MSYSHKLYKVESQPSGFLAFVIVFALAVAAALIGLYKFIPTLDLKRMSFTHLTYLNFEKVMFYSKYYGRNRPVIFGSSELSATFEFDADPYHFKTFFTNYKSPVTPLVLGSANAHDFFHATMLAAGVADPKQPVFIFLGVQHFDGAVAPQEKYKNTRFNGTTLERFKMHLDDTLVERAVVNLSPRSSVAKEYAKQALRFVTSKDEPTLFRYLQHVVVDDTTNDLMAMVMWPVLRVKLYGEDYRELFLFLKNAVAGENPRQDKAESDKPPLPTPDQVESSRDDIIKLAKSKSMGNKYGISDGYWKKYMKPTEEWLAKHPAPNSSGTYVSMKSSEWADYTLLTDIIQTKHLNVQMVIPPIQKKLYQDLGFDVSMMGDFYKRIETIAAAHNIPLLSLGAHSGELYWCRDPFHHGWLSNIAYYRLMYDHFGLGKQ